MTTIISSEPDVKKRGFSDAPSKLQPKLNKLADKIAREADYEPPVAYWRGLWDKPHEKPRQTHVKLQFQGSVVRVKARRPVGQSGSTFERDWDKKPDDWGENFLLDGYDRLNPHDRAIYVKKPKTGNKSEIKEFSKASRRNLVDKMCSLKMLLWLRAWFVTLTYHNDYPDPKGAKAHLRAFYKRINYYAKSHGHTKNIAMIWRVEPQKRGAPHFHLFLFNAPKIPKYMLLQWWQEIVGDASINQLDRQFLSTRRKAMNYLSKYISKPEQLLSAEGGEAAHLDIALYWAKAGRYWGSEGLTDDMFAHVYEIVCDITDDGLLRFVAAMEYAYPHLVDRWSFGFKIFNYEKSADGIYALAALLITGEIIEGFSGGGLHNASPHADWGLINDAVGEGVINN